MCAACRSLHVCLSVDVFAWIFVITKRRKVYGGWAAEYCFLEKNIFFAFFSPYYIGCNVNVVCFKTYVCAV